MGETLVVLLYGIQKFLVNIKNVPIYCHIWANLDIQLKLLVSLARGTSTEEQQYCCVLSVVICSKLIDETAVDNIIT